MTTSEPGASEVFTHGWLDRPFASAFCASSAAPISTAGLEVLVHEVMAAMTTAPSLSRKVLPLSVTSTGPADGRSFCSEAKAVW